MSGRLLYVETNLNLSSNAVCEFWRRSGRAHPDKPYLKPERYEGIEDRGTGPASTPRVQTWPEGLTAAPVWYGLPRTRGPNGRRTPRPCSIRPYVVDPDSVWIQPAAVNIYGDAEPFEMHDQRWENGKRVDRWSNDPAMYKRGAHVSSRVEPSKIGGELWPRGLPIEGDLPVYDESKPPLHFIGEDPGMEDVLGFMSPYHTRTHRSRPRHQTGWVWDSDWNEKVAFCPMPITESSTYLFYGCDEKGWWLYENRKRPLGVPFYKDIPAHELLPSFAARPADWLRRMFERERNAWAKFWSSPLRIVWQELLKRDGVDDRSGWKDYRGLAKMHSPIASLNPAKHRTKKDLKAGWPLQPFEDCLRYRLLVSSRCRPEDYAPVFKGRRVVYGDIQRGMILHLAVIMRFRGAQCDLNSGDSGFEEVADGVWKFEIEVDPLVQMAQFVPPEPWIDEDPPDEVIEERLVLEILAGNLDPHVKAMVMMKHLHPDWTDEMIAHELGAQYPKGAKRYLPNGLPRKRKKEPKPVKPLTADGVKKAIQRARNDPRSG